MNFPMIVLQACVLYCENVILGMNNKYLAQYGEKERKNVSNSRGLAEDQRTDFCR